MIMEIGMIHQIFLNLNRMMIIIKVTMTIVQSLLFPIIKIQKLRICVIIEPLFLMESPHKEVRLVNLKPMKLHLHNLLQTLRHVNLWELF